MEIKIITSLPKILSALLKQGQACFGGLVFLCRFAFCFSAFIPYTGKLTMESASGILITLLAGDGTLPISFGGSVLAMQERLFQQFFCCSGRVGEQGVNRAAEAMTIFAVMCAGQFPIWHMGRVWVGFYVMPYPNSRGPLWPNFNSALLWDVFAVSTYFTVSLLFWYSGLLPDLATVRDRAKTKFRKMFYGLASFGWTGSTKHWQRQESLALVLAGLATPLVLSVHTIVSFDFATGIVPGWHTTIFPPYFVAGAIFSGFAMVQTLLIITRKVLHLEDYITVGHIEAMNKVIVLTGSIVGCAYITELFTAWYSGNPYEWWAFRQNRVNIFSPYGWAYYGMMFCNVVSPQLFWSRKLRRNITFTFFMSVLINVGMWFERFVIIVTSLYRDFLPSSWSTYYSPTIWEVGFFLGTFGLFFTCYFLFAKYFPVIALAEVKAILKTSGENYKGKMTEMEKMDSEKFYIEEVEHAH